MRQCIRLLPVAFALLSGSVAAQEMPGSPQISATGRGEVRVKPTRATIYFTVQGKSTTAALAAAQNAKLVASTIRALTAAGLKADDISNSAYNVMPDYEFSASGRKQIGFVASNGIRVEVGNISEIGRIIDAGLSGGATQVASAQYSGDRMNDARRDALKEAVEEARRDAETMAAAAGGALGRLMMVTSGAPAMPMQRDVNYEVAMASSAGGSTSIRPNELIVAAITSARWEFIPRK
jgi:uncharacterized protein